MIKTRIIVPVTTDAEPAYRLAASVVDFDCDCRLIDYQPNGNPYAWPAFLADCLESDGGRPLFVVSEGYAVDSDKLLELADRPEQIMCGPWGFYMRPLDVVRNFVLIWFRRSFHAKVWDENIKAARRLTVDEAFTVTQNDMTGELTVACVDATEVGLKKC